MNSENHDILWDYATKSKKYRTKLKYFIILSLYFLHIEKDHGYLISKKFQKSRLKDITDLIKPNEISIILNSMRNFSLVYAEERKVKNRRTINYSLGKGAFISFFAYFHNKRRTISIKPLTEINYLLDVSDMTDDIIPEKSLSNKKLFHNITDDTLIKLLFYIQYYSKNIKPEQILGNITKYTKYDFYTFFIHVLDILEALYQYHVVSTFLKTYNELNVYSEQYHTIHNNNLDTIYDLKYHNVILVYKKTKYTEKQYKEASKNNTRFVKEQFFEIYNITYLKELEKELKRHYFLRGRSDKQLRELTQTFYNNSIRELIAFIKDTIINYLAEDRH